MVRTETLIYPPRAPAPLLPAATVLLLRDTPAGIEVLMTRRSDKASFAPGAFVFPGGGVDDADRQHALAATSQTTALTRTPHIATRPEQTQAACAQALAAIRESFEELGILLARKPNSAAPGAAASGWCTQSDIANLDRDGDFYQQIAANKYTLAADNVFLLAHWVTDRDLPRRFDVPFLVARMPQNQAPVADNKEQFSPEWVRPQNALSRHADGSFAMIFPTVRTLQRLQDFKTVDAVLQACADQPLWTSCPRAGLHGGKETRFMEHEAPFGELAMVCPDGHIIHPLDWQHDLPVRLLAHVMRLTAPNPGMMTGPGTNTYIIGTQDTGYVVVDPGPQDMAHIGRIMLATGGDINAIVCTHSHADHSPGATSLQALVVEATNTVPGDLMDQYARHICPILGLPSAPTARDNAYFDPDITLDHGELLSQYFRGSANGAAADDMIDVATAELGYLPITLQVIHTPGHAANHLCLLLQEDGLLISGDHILNGSTTVIDPPDGDMTTYLASLDTLSAACHAYQADFILPAHGYVLTHCRGISHTGGAARAIAALKTHRLNREAKVIAAMRTKPGAKLDELVQLAYGDVPPAVWPIAKRSLSAHMQRIEALGLLVG